MSVGQDQYIYILTLDKGGYYIGRTYSLERHITEHYSGMVLETHGRNPQLVWSENWNNTLCSAEKRVEELTKLFKDNPSGMLFRLQARLPLGGIRWG